MACLDGYVIFELTGIRSPDRPARNESLYRQWECSGWNRKEIKYLLINIYICISKNFWILEGCNFCLEELNKETYGRKFWKVGLRLLACRYCGLESRWWHGFLSLVIVVGCELEHSVTGRSPEQRSLTKWLCVRVWSWHIQSEEALAEWGCRGIRETNSRKHFHISRPCLSLPPITLECWGVNFIIICE
jgi:hypothetical protein